MSVAATAFVEEMFRAKTMRLTTSQWRVLGAIAYRYDDRVACCYASVRNIALKALISEGHCRRIMRQLEDAGRIVTYEVVRDHDKSQGSNEIEIVGMKSTAVGADDRRRVFKGSRTRVPAQLQLMPRDLTRETQAACTAVGQECRQQVSQGQSVAESESRQAPDVWESAVESERKCSPPLEQRCLPPGEHLMFARVVNYEEPYVNIPPHQFPFGSEAVEKNFPVSGEIEIGHAAKPQHQAVARWTRGDAKATTKASVAVADDAVGEAMNRSGSIGKRAGRGGRLDLDGDEAALWDEATQVLLQGGVAPDDSTRRERAAVTEALAAHVVRAGCSIADAGQLMRDRWAQYRAQVHLMQRALGLRRFVREGLWLQVDSWPWDRDALEQQRMRRRAVVGTTCQLASDSSCNA